MKFIDRFSGELYDPFERRRQKEKDERDASLKEREISAIEKLARAIKSSKRKSSHKPRRSPLKSNIGKAPAHIKTAYEQYLHALDADASLNARKPQSIYAAVKKRLRESGEEMTDKASWLRYIRAAKQIFESHTDSAD